MAKCSPRHRGLPLLVLLVGFMGHTAHAQDEPIPISACLTCHANEGLSTTLPSGEQLPLWVNMQEFSESVHGKSGLTCVSCHRDISGFPHPPLAARDRRELTLRYYTNCRTCHQGQYEKTLDSIHLRVLAAGHREAPVCTDCHGSHNVSLPAQPRFKVDLTCARCHEQIFEVYKESVHGAAFVKEANNVDVPTCSNCHGVHGIEDPHSLKFRLHSPQVCAECHTDRARMEKYGLSTDVLRTYVADFHGTTTQLFQPRPGARRNEAVCYDCHGVHDIKGADDPKSRVIKENILKTCQQCHPTATASFPASWVKHYNPSPSEFPLVYYIELFYKILIPLVIGFFLIYILLDWIRHLRGRVHR